MEILSLKETPLEFRISLAKELGFGVDPDGVHLLKDGEPALDPYTQTPLRLDSMAILPGSVVLLDNNPVSIASYLEDHGDVL